MKLILKLKLIEVKIKLLTDTKFGQKRDIFVNLLKLWYHYFFPFGGGNDTGNIL